MPGATFIATDQIELRTEEPEDLEWINRCQNDPRIWQSMAMHTPTELKRQQQAYENKERDDGTIGLLVCTDGEPVGSVWLRQEGIDERYGNAMLGYWIDPEEWNNGYATAAVELLTGYGFDHLRLHKVYADVFEFNPASMRVLEANGFTKEGIHRKEAFVNGAYHDRHRYAVLVEEWREADTQVQSE